MTPFYFGDADKPLFGIHHQPKSSQFQDASIVLCNPIGFEYGRAHSVIRYLAKKIALNGYHVLRFDYFATGDSSGYSHDITISQCIKNIELACDEIKIMSATRKVSVIGYRYGALLAAYASQSYKFNHLVMWDPVVDGEVYLNDLQGMHSQMLKDPDRFDPRYISDTGSFTELIGHNFSAPFRNEIKTFSLDKLEKIKTKKIDVFVCTDKDSDNALLKNNNFLVNARLHKCECQSEWTNINKIESKVLPDMLIEKIIEVTG